MQLEKRYREGWLVGTKEEVEEGEVNYCKGLREAKAGNVSYMPIIKFSGTEVEVKWCPELSVLTQCDGACGP